MANVLRSPGLQILVNGSPIAGALSAKVAVTAWHAAARFRVMFALSAVDSAWLNAQDALEIEVLAGLEGNWASLVLGMADSIRINPSRGEIEIEGRVLTATLLEARTQEAFPNHTASEVVGLVAARHGLNAVTTPTRDLVGRVDQGGWSRQTLDQHARATTEWDLLVALAQQEQYELYVSGKDLNFNPEPTAGVGIVSLAPEDCVDLCVERSLVLSQQVEVVVKSWNARDRRMRTQSARSGTTGGLKQNVYLRPNLTDQQAVQIANAALSDLMSHAQVLSATMPGELDLTPRSFVGLTGTNSGYDGTYRVVSIDRTISVDRGFIQRLRAKAI